MKFTLSWLKDHLETDATLEEIVERLTSLGLEVEEVDDKSQFAPFTIAKVLTAEKHPDADKLRVLSVDIGDGKPVQVVCGAPNARAGMIGAFAGPGTYVPGIDTTLSVGNIRGVDSFGMMCSERELEMSDSHDGIIDLADDAPIGTSFASYAKLDDPVIDIGLTPNRPDCTGVYGIARDLAASGMGKLKDGSVEHINGEGDCPVTLKINNPELCPGFALRLVKGVKNGPSPKWLQQRLIAIGLRPINALVDITNYITFDRGRPLHVFDAAKVTGDLVVRLANDGEKILGLDGKEYALSPDNLIIADDKGPESIAGIMGGEESGCDENTVDVLIESALWNEINIAKTGRALGIITDARYRFERGVDPEFMVGGVELATKLVTEICGGTPSKTQITGYKDYTAKEITFPFSEVERLIGIPVDAARSVEILESLGFGVKENGDSALVTVPSWRPDIDGKADLVEEVMRVYGVNNIEPQPLPQLNHVGGKILTTLQTRTRQAKRALASRGMLEAVNWSFISEDQAKAFGGGNEMLKLTNPISADMSDMRPSLLPGLIVAAGRNAARGIGDVAIFEVSGIYENDTEKGQRRVASGIRKGTAGLSGSGRDWAGNSQTVGVFDAKADAFAALEACGLATANLQIFAEAPDFYHPGRSGVIKLGPKVVLGHFGEFHPNVLDLLDVKGPICGFEIYIDALPEPKKKATKTKPAMVLSSFQMLTRDFAFVVDSDVTAALILRAAQGADKQLIAGVKVFDLFEGASLGEGKKSVALEVTIQPTDRTLTDEDLDALHTKIVANVEKTTGGKLRA
ncbi:phenylalanine--tRNA ligase subunit beta [Ahrensia kielensis]|uniref:phenylalanine--tRNA ligase subunit beta n=1 Tax=Ahrensia kielensis TaxID=76980 RepID=UPI00037B36FB|nr:phenylalanine--tRNA ligase subunit beta [Ahrensia kielensis]